MVGRAVLAVWFPLLVAGILSLRSRGRFGDSDALIVTGPYAYVRHPLYAGLSMTVFGLGLTIGSRHLALGGVGWLMVTRLWSLHEERGLAERFGPDYDAYVARVPAMIPSIPRLVRSARREHDRRIAAPK